MTDAFRADPQTIRQGFLSVFGEAGAERWTRCVAALPVPDAPSDDDLGLALVVWATNLDDLAHVRAVLDTFTLQQVQVVGNGEGLTLTAAEAMTSPVLRAFVQRTLTQAAGKCLSDPDHWNALQNLAVRDDDTGSSGTDLAYVRDGLSITAYYGDPVLPARIVNMRMVSADALRDVVQGGPPVAEPDQAEAGERAHGVGAIGPVLEVAA